MKKPYYILLPIVIGLALIFIGAATHSVLSYVGVGILFGGSLLCAIISTVLTVVRAVKSEDHEIFPDSSDPDDTAEQYDNDSDEYAYGAEDDIDIDDDSDGTLPPDRRIEERERLARINSSHGYSSRIARAEHELAHSAQAYRHSDRGEKIKGALIVIGFIGFAVIGMILLALDLIVPGVIVFCCAPLMIFVLLIAVKIKEHMSMSENYDPADYDRKIGTVKYCVMSSSVSTGKRTVRTVSVVYRVVVEIDGIEYNAYSKEFYNDGETIVVLLHKNGKTVKIVDGAPEDELAKTRIENTNACDNTQSAEDNIADPAERLAVIERQSKLKKYKRNPCLANDEDEKNQIL